MSFNHGRETIHISLGSTANVVSSHLLNLNGLAATTDAFEANVTHSIHNGLYVPRCFFVEEGEALQFQSQSLDPTATASNTVHTCTDTMASVDNPYMHAANALAYSQHSRYRAKPSQRIGIHGLGASTVTSNGRHVDWGDADDDEYEKDDDEIDDREEEQRKRQRRERDRWQEQTMQPLQTLLEKHWTTPDRHAKDIQASADETIGTVNESVGDKSTKDTQTPLDYMTFFAPPFPSNYLCLLPFSSKSNVIETWDSYSIASSKFTASWNEQTMFENLRKLLEQSDAVQGTTIVTQGHGIYAGLTAVLLQELQDECKSAGRIVVHVTDPIVSATESSIVQGSWKTAHIQSVRNDIESGLAQHDFGQTAHVIVPVEITVPETALFQRSSQIAMAWEAATLAYRAKSPLMATGYGDMPSRLTMREFISSLQPMERYKLLELDYLTESYHNVSLIPGTSIERRHLQKNRESLSRLEPPGEWIETSLTSLSPGCNIQAKKNKRSLHHHWSLVSTMRTSTKSQDDLTCIMEGMGIRYRPELSLGVLVDQSFKTLVSGGYAAGAYWNIDESDQTVVAVLSNSTRSYSFAKKVANNMKDKLTMLKFKGYHNRDVTNGVLPEKEDCIEAMEYCLALRDTYHPPDGSGLGEDGEGTYFDD